ncbi:hypothetical protein TCAL_14637 [Tigriopus californicus]|uniref:F5/8 type C domain-containing protein n=1 Tax=Tigriopus californicus TaxID=6832 RepID=A0A553P8L3_TIGCA|nr:hypothetical protein TCAL_14637 [Tigriopus californicus]
MEKKKPYLVAETMCALICHANQDCIEYVYLGQDLLTLDGMSKIETGQENCILVNSTEIVPIRSPLNGIVRTIVKSNNSVIHTTDQRSPNVIRAQAWAAGFNQSIEVGSDVFFLMEMSSTATYTKAMLKCLNHGGILPMEDSDEFVEQMSILAGDHSTPRFISLAQEKSIDGSTMSLVWTLGNIIWTQGEDLSKCSKCQDWSFSKDYQQVATINPNTKMYENISPNHRTSKYYCQFLGSNLASHKRVVVSSTYRPRHPSERAVDGHPYQDRSFWHSSYKVPEGEWISVDLGQEFIISSVLILGRSNWFNNRNRNIQVWIGGPEPQEGVALATQGRIFCAQYPFQQYGFQLSGLTCPTLNLGRFVTFLNSPVKRYFQINELAIYGLSIHL